MGNEIKLKRLPAVFFRNANGREPVLEWLKSLPAEDRRVVGGDLKDVEYGWPIGMPLCRSLGKGLWEVRSNLAQGRIARVIFCVHEEKLVALHGFIKKAQKTPRNELETAWKRKRELEQ